jgi:hypothetical protein
MYGQKTQDYENKWRDWRVKKTDLARPLVGFKMTAGGVESPPQKLLCSSLHHLFKLKEQLLLHLSFFLSKLLIRILDPTQMSSSAGLMQWDGPGNLHKQSMEQQHPKREASS